MLALALACVAILSCTSIPFLGSTLPMSPVAASSIQRLDCTQITLPLTHAYVMLAKRGVVLVLFPFPSASRAAPPWQGRTVTEEDAFADACPVFASTYMPMYLVVPLTVPFIHAKCFPWRRSPSPILNLTCMHSRMLMVVCWSPLAFTLYSVFALSSIYLSACHYACCPYLIYARVSLPI